MTTTINYTGSVQTCTVKVTGTYDVTAYGAQSGEASLSGVPGQAVLEIELTACTAYPIASASPETHIAA
jgi:hypothetical protein